MANIKYLNATVNGISIDNSPTAGNTLWFDTDGFVNFVEAVHTKGCGMSIQLTEEDVKDFVNFLEDGQALSIFFDDEVQDTVEDIHSALVDSLKESK